MTQSRTNKAARAAKACLCSPDGKLHEHGMLFMSDLAKYARIGSSPEVKDATGRTDMFLTGKVVGLQEAYRRIEKLLAISERETYGLAMLQWPQDQNDE